MEVHGVDFSGASDAGLRIWISSGAAVSGRLRVTCVRRARDLPGSGTRRDPCLRALAEFVRSRPGALFGFDFPFGLPRSLVREARWEAFVARFPARFKGPRQFRDNCRAAAGGREIKRLTDERTRTPFCAYNLRLYRQTYFGIRRLLHPLVTGGHARALPMQAPAAGAARVVEVCPASTLKREGLYRPYKGPGSAPRAARGRILEAILGTGEVSLSSRALRRAPVEDSGGDALDSLIVAWAAFRAHRARFSFADYRRARREVEGHVCV